jgi:hypothetical protein
LDNWMVLYLDGKAILAEHRINIEDVLEAIGVEHTYKYYEHDDPVGKRAVWDEIPDELYKLEQWEMDDDWKEPSL